MKETLGGRFFPKVPNARWRNKSVRPVLPCLGRMLWLEVHFDVVSGLFLLGGREVTKKERRVVVAQTREDLLIRALAAARSGSFFLFLERARSSPWRTRVLVRCGGGGPEVPVNLSAEVMVPPAPPGVEGRGATRPFSCRCLLGKVWCSAAR